jgi:hypothetical protein
MLQVKHYDTSAKTKELIKTAIERNFNGAIYLFGEGADASERPPSLICMMVSL